MERKEHLFPYEWRIADGYPAQGIEKHGCKVFGTFICGGGSSMGYKLAGFEHLGGVEIDERIAAIYEDNHHPKFLFKEDLRIFNERKDLPAELYNLDLLDGSPPCSTFSMAGSREDAWGKKKQFAEGQAVQTLDDLVFIYCDTILKLQPKCFLLENVKGLTAGNAKSYLLRIIQKLNRGGIVRRSLYSMPRQWAYRRSESAHSSLATRRNSICRNSSSISTRSRYSSRRSLIRVIHHAL